MSITSRLKKTTMFKNYVNQKLILEQNQRAVVPEVGMGATTGAGSDCYPHTIVEVADDLSYIIIQSDNYKALKTVPYGEDPGFSYSPDLTGARVKYTLRKNGRYICDGCPMKHYFQSVAIGYRRFYQDPHF